MARLIVTLEDGRQLAFPADLPKPVVQRAIDIYTGRRKPGEFTSGERFGRVVEKTKAGTLEGVGTILRKFGAEDTGLEMLQSGLKKSKDADLIAPPPMEYDQVEGIGDAFSFVGQNLAEMAPQIATPIATTIGGTMIGGPVGGVVGLGAGVAANYPAYVGENIEAQIDSGVAPEDTSAGIAMGSGAVNAALDVIPPTRAFRMLRPLSSDIGEAALEKVAKEGLGKRVAKRVGETAALEGATEAVQQTITLGQAGIANPELSALGYISENAGQIADAGVTGGLMGGVLGGIGGTLRGDVGKGQPKPDTEIDPVMQPQRFGLKAGDGAIFDVGMDSPLAGEIMGVDPDTGVYRVRFSDGSMADLSDAQVVKAMPRVAPLGITHQPQPMEGEVLPPLDKGPDFVAGDAGIAGYGVRTAQDTYDEYVGPRPPKQLPALPAPEAKPDYIAGAAGVTRGPVEEYDRMAEMKALIERMRELSGQPKALTQRDDTPYKMNTDSSGVTTQQPVSPLDEKRLARRTGKVQKQPDDGLFAPKAKQFRPEEPVIAPKQEVPPAPVAPVTKDSGRKEGVKKALDAGAQLYSVDPTQVKIDPKQYQFKGNVDEKGADDSLKTVKQWSDMLANPVLLHERENGDLYVADGHQRVNLAQRLRAEGRGPLNIPAKVISERDGYSVADARNVGAYINIANESGSATDMAKVMRSLGKEGTDTSKLPPLPMSMSKPKQRTARELAKLGDNAFGMVVNGAVPENYARIVGEKLPSADRDGEQTAILDLISKGGPKNESEARTMVDLAMDSGFTTDTQTGLFGEEQIQSSLFKEKSQIINEAMKSLRTAAKTFGQLAQRAGLIEEEGNVLNMDANERRSREEARGAEALTKLATRKGELADELNQLATGLKAGTIKRADAGRRLADAAKRFINPGTNKKPNRGEPANRQAVAPKDAGAVPAKATEKTEPIVEKTEAGEQTVIPGAEKVSDRAVAEKRMEGKKESTVTQKPADDGLFDLGARTQKNLFSLGETHADGYDYDGMSVNEEALSRDEMRDSVIAAARQIIGNAADRVLRTQGKIRADKHQPKLAGKSIPGVYTSDDQIIRIALQAPDPAGTFRHEAIHFLKDIGVLNGADWQALTKQAKKWREQFDTDSRYKELKLTEEQLNEEAIADAYKAWANGALPVPTTLERILDKMQQFFDAVLSALQGKGIRQWQDVFSAIESGKFAEEIPSAPGYKLSARESGGTNVTTPDGAVIPYPTRRAAEYGATQDAINAHYNRALPKFSLPEKDYEKVQRDLKRVIHIDDRSTFQRWADAWADMRANGFANTFGDFTDKVTFAVTDDLHFIKRSQQKHFGDEVKDRKLLGYRMARAVRHLGGVFESSLLFGQLKWDAKNKSTGIDMKKKGLLEILAPVMADKKTSDAFKLYSYARNVTAKNPKMRNGKKEMLSLLDEGKEKNMTPQMAKEALALAQHYNTKIGGKNVNIFDRAFSDLQEWKRSYLDIAVATGRLPQKAREFWDKADHIPFHRIMEDAERQVIRGSRSFKLRELTGGKKLFHVVDGGDNIVETFANRAEAMAALKAAGAGHKIIEGAPLVNDLVENIAHNAITMLENSLRNAAMREIIGIALQSGDAKLVRRTFSMDKEGEILRQNLIKSGLDPQDMPKDLMESMESFMPSVSGNIVSVHIDGKPVRYEVNDPFLLKSIAHLNRAVSGIPSMGWFGGAKQFLTRMVTLSPAFMVRNFTRDSMQAYIQGADNFTPMLDSLKGLKEAVESNPDMMELMAHGGDTGWYSVNPEDVRKRLKKVEHEINQGRKAKGRDIVMDWVNPLNLLDNLERIGRRVEMANRIAVYKRALEAGSSKSEAAFEAAEVLDFGMRGSSHFVQMATAVLPFLNARLQGQWRQFRAMGAGNKEQFHNFWRRASTLAGISVLLGFINASDDPQNPESYSALPSWVKDGFWNLPIGRFNREVLGMPAEEGDLNFIHLPKPFELGLLTSTVFERAIQSMMGNDTGSDSAKALRDAMVGTLAFNPLSNPLFGLPMQLRSNYDSFRGQMIEPLSLKHYDTPERYTEYTTKTAKELSVALDKFAVTRSLDASPTEIEFVINGFMGDMGRIALYLGDQLFNTLTNQPPSPALRKDDIMLVRSFMSEYPAKSTQYREKLYELNEEANQLVASINLASKEGNIDRLRDLADRPRNKALMGIKPQVNAMAQQMRDQRALMRQVQSSTKMSSEQKLRTRNLINQRMNAIAAQYRKLEDRVEQLSER